MTSPENPLTGSGFPVPGSGSQTKDPTSVPEPTTQNPEPPLDPRVRLLHDFFFNRTDKLAIKGRRGTPFPVAPRKGNLLELLQTHVLGRYAPKAKVERLTKNNAQIIESHFRIGSYAPALDGTTRWLCIDFDGAGHRNPLKDAAAAALQTVLNFRSNQIPCYLERSGGGQGYHVWVFFDDPVPASAARALGLKLVCQDAPLMKGGFANPLSSLGIEVFPKQAHIAKNGFGNMVYLPWWHGAGNGANQFFEVSTDGFLGATPCLPECFETMSALDLEWMFVDLTITSQSPQEKVATTNTRSNAVWTTWNRDALEKLNLADVYNPWLVEEENPGKDWVTCRDPFAANGDQNPSAGVATGKGLAKRGTLHSFITGANTSVFDFLIKTGKAASFHEARDLLARLSGVALPTRTGQSPTTTPYSAKTPGFSATRPGIQPASTSIPPASASQPAHLSRGFKPSIQINSRPPEDVIEETWAAIRRVNHPPFLFQRGGSMAQIRLDKETPFIEQMDEGALYGRLIRTCHWVRVGNEKTDFVAPTREILRDMLIYSDPPLPKLEAMVQVPVFGRSGKLLQTSGYHVEDHLWYQPQKGMPLPPVPENPTQSDLTQARNLFLDDLLVDFSFVSESDRAHFMAAALLPFVRRLINGPTPLHLIEAPTMGSGKSMLAHLLAIIATGKIADVGSLPEYEEERRKVITTMLSRARPIILLDNASQKTTLDSAALAAVLTAQVWTDRLLGHTRSLELPNHALWLMTGNNPKLTLELARRCLRIRIDPGTDKPWQRQRFKHPDLMEWAEENRGRLIHALLTMVQAWIAQGKPLGRQRLGSYEKWSAVVGGILQVAGLPNFMGNLDSLYEEADNDGQMWRTFTQEWWSSFQGTPKRVKDLNSLCDERDLLCQVRGEKSLQSQITRLGNALSKHRDRAFGNLRIKRVVQQELGGGGLLYVLEPVGGPDGTGPEPLDEPLDQGFEPLKIDLVDLTRFGDAE